MKSIGIISTFPSAGSRNIGDYLISKSTESAVKKIYPGCTITFYFRADKWEDIRESIHEQDHLIFACLAIRQGSMRTKIYPYIEDILKSGIPFTILAAGTQLPFGRKTTDTPESWPLEDRNLLNELNNKSVGFATRGSVTQEFCSALGLQTSNNGDIAFFDERYDSKLFAPRRPIKRIAISDPHYWRSYMNEFKSLYYGLEKRYPDAEIVVVMHGKSGFQELLKTSGFNVKLIYQNLDDGLDIYENIDLHVGFRVHAHVSALSRRTYSYLIEQDGRGCDYGRYMNANISVPCFVSKTEILWSKIFPPRNLSEVKSKQRSSAITQLLSMIDKDQKDGFACFAGLEGQINKINKDNLDFLKACLGSKDA